MSWDVTRRQAIQAAAALVAGASLPAVGSTVETLPNFVGLPGPRPKMRLVPVLIFDSISGGEKHKLMEMSETQYQRLLGAMDNLLLPYQECKGLLLYQPLDHFDISGGKEDDDTIRTRGDKA